MEFQTVREALGPFGNLPLPLLALEAQFRGEQLEVQEVTADAFTGVSSSR